MWLRLKSLQLFESAHIFLMLYNADDKDSFENIESIYHDFQEANQVGAYIVLVSIISHDIISKRAYKDIKKAHAYEFMQ